MTHFWDKFEMVFTSITQRKKTPGYSRVGSSLTHRRPILADPAVQCYTVKKRSSDERLALGVPTCVARWGHKCPRPASPHPCCVRRNRRTAVRRLCSCPPRPCLNKPRFSKVFQGFPPRPSLIKSVNKPTNQGFCGEEELKNSAGIPVYDSQDYQIFP